MTCEDCLAALATASLREMTPDSVVMQHCATCPDCARVTTVLREKEYETATILNSLPPMSNPLAVAENAVGTSQRRRMGRVVVMAAGTALVATIWIVAATLVIPALNRGDMRIASELRTETMQLSCLSPQQAADIINPYVRSHGSTYYLPSSGISAITVRGRPAELAKSRDLIAHFERDPSAACHVTEGSLLKPGTSLLTPQGQNGAVIVTTPNPVPAAPKR
jgi:type II secretory pathway component GspD/PulD (secretin)